MSLKHVIDSMVEYSIECLPEDLEIEGNACACGEKDCTEKHIKPIINDLESGNQWAWCCVKMIARIPGIDLEGTDYLGGCSYKSGDDFRRDGYFEDMKALALDDLKAKLSTLLNNLKKASLI